MGIGVTLLKLLNHCFPQQRHPFNLRNAGEETYSEWQYEMGEKTIAVYSEKYSKEDMFKGKTVLDMGCGAAGKTLYYASLGAKKIVGTDAVEEYKSEAEKMAKNLGLESVFSFVRADAAHLPFDDEAFDTIIMNDFMEHVSEPKAILAEAFRLLKRGGKFIQTFRHTSIRLVRI